MQVSQSPAQPGMNWLPYLVGIVVVIALGMVVLSSQAVAPVGEIPVYNSSNFNAEVPLAESSLYRSTRPVGIRDGRLNRYDIGAPIAVYCTREGSLLILNIDPTTGQGSAGAEFEAEDFRPYVDPKTGQFIPPAENQLLVQQNGVSLYLLSSGQLQINAFDFEGKVYDFAFDLSLFGRCRKEILEPLGYPTPVG
jgi:hypothetical protein